MTTKKSEDDDQTMAIQNLGIRILDVAKEELVHWYILYKVIKSCTATFTTTYYSLLSAYT
jgi:hypothetical protein